MGAVPGGSALFSAYYSGTHKTAKKQSNQATGGKQGLRGMGKGMGMDVDIGMGLGVGVGMGSGLVMKRCQSLIHHARSGSHHRYSCSSRVNIST